MIDKQSLMLRTQEILQGHPEGMAAEEAFAQAVLERYGSNPRLIAEVAASYAHSLLRTFVKRTYDLPEETGTLFQVPPVIGIHDAERGELLVQRDHAQTGQVLQWLDEGFQHHSVQRLRFGRARQQAEPLRSEDPLAPWLEAREKLRAIEAPDDQE